MFVIMKHYVKYAALYYYVDPSGRSFWIMLWLLRFFLCIEVWWCIFFWPYQAFWGFSFGSKLSSTSTCAFTLDPNYPKMIFATSLRQLLRFKKLYLTTTGLTSFYFTILWWKYLYLTILWFYFYFTTRVKFSSRISQAQLIVK